MKGFRMFALPLLGAAISAAALAQGAGNPGDSTVAMSRIQSETLAAFLQRGASRPPAYRAPVGIHRARHDRV